MNPFPSLEVNCPTLSLIFNRGLSLTMKSHKLKRLIHYKMYQAIDEKIAMQKIMIRV